MNVAVARTASEDTLVAYDEKARFSTVFNDKPRSFSVRLRNAFKHVDLPRDEDALVIFERHKNKYAGRAYDTDIMIWQDKNRKATVLLSSGDRSTHKLESTVDLAILGHALRSMLISYGAPIKSAVASIAAKHDMRVIARVGGEHQLASFSDFFSNVPQSLNVNGHRFEQSSNIGSIRYRLKPDQYIDIYVEIAQSHQGMGAAFITISVDVDADYVGTRLAHEFRVNSSEHRTFNNIEFREAMRFVSGNIDVDAIKQQVEDLRREYLNRKRERVLKSHEAKAWPNAVAINDVMLWRVKASRNYLGNRHIAPSISDRSMSLETRSIFYVKYASPRVEQDGKMISSVQLHIAPETGDIIIGMQGPRTNSVSISDGSSKVRSAKTRVPVDLQAVINKVAVFLLPYMQKHSLTTATTPSAHIIKQGREIHV